ncbi:MAG TPA: hypothetical protein VFV48_08710, partial [Pseudomonadales bacterium]|nr:hypothetical protein [Pseudomonadales bacterium]
LKVRHVARKGLALLWLLPFTVVAETTLAPDVHISSDYDSNKRLQLDNRDAVQGVVAEAGVTLKNNSPQWSQELNTQLKSQHYGGAYGLGSDDQNVNGSLSYNTPRTITTLTLGAINDTTLTDQLDFSGYTEAQKRRHYLTTGLSFQSKLSALDTGTLDYSASKSDYIDAKETSLVNYRYETLSGSLQHSFSENVAMYSSVADSHYDAKANANTSDSLDISAGVLWKPSSPWQLKFGVGKRSTNYDYFGGLVSLDDHFNYVILETSRQLQTGLLSLKTQDQSQPTGDGNLYHVRKVLLDYSTEFDLRHRLSMSAAYSEQRASSDRYTWNDRNNMQWRATYRYRTTQAAGIQTVWSYQQQELIKIHTQAYSNAIWLGVYWAPDAYRW